MTLETSWVNRDMYNRSKKWNRIELAICLKFKIDIYVLPNFQILLKVQDYSILFPLYGRHLLHLRAIVDR